MNTHDKYELPPLPPHPPAAHMGGRHMQADCQFPVLYKWAKAYAISAVEADRKRRGEPVAWMTSDKRHIAFGDQLTKEEAAQYGWTPLYIAPQPAEPVKKKPYAQGSALGEFGIIPMCDQVNAEPVKVPECSCEACEPNTVGNIRMIVCAICGNKRCPHATDHRHACTGSNEPGQKGSSYEHCTAPAQPAPASDDPTPEEEAWQRMERRS